VPKTSSDDGFLSLLNQCGGAATQVKAVFDTCPLACERLLALSAGNCDEKLDWFHPSRLDSFALNAEELINRITFCQEDEDKVAAFRVRRMRLCAHLWNIQIPNSAPAAMNLGAGFVLDWKSNAPHQNLHCANDELATVMYLGEDVSDATVDRAYRAARERLHRSMNEVVGDQAKSRVVVWFRDINGNLQRRWTPPAFDRKRDESEFDIGRAG
jgi:hypothetical protein